MSLQHILKNSSVSGKEPLASQLANGELSINYHADGPFLCCKDTAGNVRRVAGVWVSATAPSTPFPGELWLDTGITPSQLKVYKNTTDAWVFVREVNSATTTTEGLVRLATDAETQVGTSAISAVTPAGLQSKVSDSTSAVSSTTLASSTAVKIVADTANAALPKSGGTITGILEIGNAGQLRFEGSSADAYETTLAVEDPTATRTITLPDRTGTVITTGDTGTVTSTMLADGTIADVDINANAEIAVSKLADGAARQLLQTDAAGTGVEWTSNVDIPGTLDVTGATTLDSTLSVPLGSAAAPSIYPGTDTNTGIYSPGADQLAVSTGGAGRLFVDSSGRVGIGTSSPSCLLDIVRGTGVGNTFRIAAEDNHSLELARIAPAINPGSVKLGVASFGDGGLAADASLALQALGQFSSLTFYSGGSTERMRLDSYGRLLVGTSSWYNIPDGYFGQNWLQGQQIKIVQANGTEYGGLAIISASPTINQRVADISLNRQDGSTDYAALSNGSAIGSVTFNGADGSKFVRAASIRAEVDGTPGANDMPGRLVFSTTADGSASPTERMRITSDGYLRLASSASGIQFNGDTAAANALDDYEEGTWTVTLHDAATGGNVSASTGTGYYTKIGRQVFCFIEVINNISTSGLTSANKLYFSLPFTSTSTTNGLGDLEWNDLTLPVAGALLRCKVERNATRGGFTIQSPTSNDGSSLLVSTLTSGSSDLRSFKFSYYA